MNLEAFEVERCIGDVRLAASYAAHAVYVSHERQELLANWCIRLIRNCLKLLRKVFNGPLCGNVQKVGSKSPIGPTLDLDPRMPRLVSLPAAGSFSPRP